MKLIGKIVSVDSATQRTIDSGATITTTHDPGFEVGDLIWRVQQPWYIEAWMAVRRWFRNAVWWVRYGWRHGY